MENSIEEKIKEIAETLENSKQTIKIKNVEFNSIEEAIKKYPNTISSSKEIITAIKKEILKEYVNTIKEITNTKQEISNNSTEIKLILKIIDTLKIKRKNVKILNIGTNIGIFVKFLKEIGFQSYGIDNNETISRINKYLEIENTKNQSIDNLNYNTFNTKFDIIICRPLIEDLTTEEIFKTFNQIFRKVFSLLDVNKFLIIKANRNNIKYSEILQIAEKYGFYELINLNKNTENEIHAIFIKKNSYLYNLKGYVVFLDKCNNKCIFCFQTQNHRVKYTTLNEFKKKIKENEYDFVNFCGEECTTNPDFLDMIDFAFEKGLQFTITSNCRKLASKEYLQNLINKGLTHVYTSLHGDTPELHEQITRTKNSFEETSQGIRNCVENNISINVNTVICKQNYKKLTEIKKYLIENLKVTKTRTSGLIDFKHENPTEVMPTYEEIKPEISRMLIYLNTTQTSFDFEKIPLCVLPQKNKKWTYYLEVVNAGNSPYCSNCKKNNECSQVPNQYLELYQTTGLQKFL